MSQKRAAELCCVPAFCLSGIQPHPGSRPTEGQRDPGEAEGTLRESTAFFLIYDILENF